ncbi:cobyrinate a,c-diamide synthase [Paenibacillus radicis (ex Xue et al. 2023)]|uniref:Cobyrinate a,c-diamide synthase n=1 Tax=Paenibacillus radicis (ex Xue et al. 2023) TaxID=2972489 RepID=A0ABT1YDV4_9BACL|nr:cobyrinate a,c-diamide synthase [Paenibacillus radicis (ex Xue et al. 2023)]MCR8631375.1 cobyrinate a,c-diamide synthase [Paenibacillus radicis (ex Xue et al. 2023)]
MTVRKMVIAGTGSGVGKTTLTIGLMAALRSMGHQVQGFKCGPDYIDPTYHTAVTGRISRNLDSYMLSHDIVKELYTRASLDADISIIEGVMGFYDGKNPKTNEGSTAEISMQLEAPVLLVVNCQSMARSAAAIVKGFQVLEPRARIVGVIANRCGSESHFRIVRDAIEQECGIPVVGFLLRNDDIQMPERHLGLVPSVERGELQPFFDRLSALITATIDVQRIWELAESPAVSLPDVDAGSSSLFRHRGSQAIKIAIAKDSAFNFYYQENIELLEAYGAECVFFSPLAGESLPEGVHGLYLGGGFPEEFADRLTADETVKESIRSAIQRGLPTLAECGGFMYLTEAIEDTKGQSFPMLGIVPGFVRMQSKLAALGYRDITGTEGNFLLGPADKAKGHEFHYSTYHPLPNTENPYAYETKGMRGAKQEGYRNEQGNLIAGYTHIHFASEPELVQRWVTKCLDYKANR